MKDNTHNTNRFIHFTKSSEKSVKQPQPQQPQPQPQQPQQQQQQQQYTSYNNTNRIVLFPTKNSDNPKAPTHTGYLIISPDMLEAYEENYIVNFVCYQNENNLIRGYAKTMTQVMEERENYKKSKENKLL